MERSRLSCARWERWEYWERWDYWELEPQREGAGAWRALLDATGDLEVIPFRLNGTGATQALTHHQLGLS